VKIIQVERTTVRDYKKLGRIDRGKSVLIGTIHHRTVIPIIGDGGPEFEGEDNFEVVRRSEDEVKAREKRRDNHRIYDNLLVAATYDQNRQAAKGLFEYEEDRNFPLDDADIQLQVVPPNDDPRILVAWRLENCYDLEGTAEILLAQTFGSRIHEGDDGSMIADKGLDMVEYLAIFKPNDRLRAIPKRPSFGNYISAAAQGWVYYMHWTTRYGKPFLSVTRKTVEAVERRKAKVKTGK
jgi:hypothetical protein